MVNSARNFMIFAQWDALSITYRTRQGDARAVRGLSLAIEPGQACGLVGESGCGTTHRIACHIPLDELRTFPPIVRMVAPTAGSA